MLNMVTGRINLSRVECKLDICCKKRNRWKRINLSRVESNDNFEKIRILIYKNNKRKTFVIKEK